MLPWKITSMQSGFHLQSIDNKFIGFLFLGGGREGVWPYLWGHEWLYNEWNREQRQQSGVPNYRRWQDKIYSTEQQCISWYSAVSLSSASPVLSSLSLSSTPARCLINSQVSPSDLALIREQTEHENQSSSRYAFRGGLYLCRSAG